MSGACSFQKISRFDEPAESLGAWHFRSGAIHRLIPPWESIRVLREASPLVDGARAEIEIRKGPIRIMLVAVHSEIDPPRQFVDTQERGPFGSWRHLHRFAAEAGGGSTLEDSIRFDPPFGPVGRLLIRGPLLKEIDRQFAFRHARTREDLRRHAEIAARFGARKLRVGVTGAGGTVGRQLCAFLSTGGHEVVRFVRGTPRGPDERAWNPSDPEHGVDPKSVEDLDIVVHLAGEGIADKRWTPERKKAIRDSRVLGTEAVARAIARAARKPEAFLCASAVGFYGDRQEWVDEQSARGDGFLADVVDAWETATKPARDAGVRTVHLRFGVVLTAAGGALAKMLMPFLMGAGGPVGSGKQGFSWVSLDDVLGATLFCARNPDISGAVNIVAPGALPQRGFAGVLGRVLRRPSFAPLPAPVVRLLFGELGQRALLEGALVRPTVLESHGFRFTHASLEDALRLELGRLHTDKAD
jgi:uncharacterized protein (TIGR01777 family)